MADEAPAAARAVRAQVGMVTTKKASDPRCQTPFALRFPIRRSCSLLLGRTQPTAVGAGVHHNHENENRGLSYYNRQRLILSIIWRDGFFGLLGFRTTSPILSEVSLNRLRSRKPILAEPCGPDRTISGQQAEMAVRETADFSCRMEVYQVTKAGLGVFRFRLFLVHGSVDYRRSGTSRILE